MSEEKDGPAKTSFTKAMRKATREIHDLSDALVNAKLGIAMTDDAVWAEGILCFYELFKFLEEALTRNRDSLLGDLDVEGMRRTDAFEEDIKHYYCEEWFKNEYVPSPAVSEYVEYLKNLEKEDPYLLAAYIYHLYMGLFSGGQILRRKRQLESMVKFRSGESRKGEAVTDFAKLNISRLKQQMVEAMERIAEELGEDYRQKLIEESKNVFRKNNKMIRTISGADKVFWRKMRNLVFVTVPVVVAVYMGSRVLMGSK